MRRGLERTFFDTALVTDALVRARYEARLASNDVYTMSRHMSDHRAPYSPEELSRISVPSLVVWCDEDQITPAAWGKAYADALKGSMFVGLQGCGHVPNLERPAEFNEAVSRFLKTIGR
jgi:pimeloyl-ACP methyl ester carboxylesterase